MNSLSQVIRAALVTLLATGAPLSLTYLLAEVSWNGVFGAGAPGRLVYLTYPEMHTVCLMGWVYFALIGAMFPAWLFDVTRRIGQQRYLPLPFSPARAALAFFVPLQQIGLPYYVVRSLRFRVEQRLSESVMVQAWWISWLLMFSGAIRIVFVNHDFEQFWLYGCATVFCIFSLLVIFGIERALEQLKEQAGKLSQESISASLSTDLLQQSTSHLVPGYDDAGEVVYVSADVTVLNSSCNE